jgi:hypothetical protein
MRHGLAFRRTVFAILLAGAIALAIGKYAQFRQTNPHLVYLTGWSVFALMLYLTAYNGRKKIPFLPLVSSRMWFQVHVYVGLFTSFVFLLHLQWHWPTGWFEGLLALLFVGVTGSGLVGWWLSRSLPPRLTTAGGEVPQERIPVVRRALREEAEQLVLGAIPMARTATLADFYGGRLAVFFAGPANFVAHVRGSRRPLNSLLGQIAEVKRFVNPEEKKIVDRLADLVRQKDALDFHRAIQLMLKGWLFVHIPLTYSLLLFSVVHIVIVYAFSGGAR